MPGKPLPPTYFFVSLCLIVAVHVLAPIATVLPLPWALGGVVPIAAGIGLNLAADQAFKAANTTVKPFERSRVLVTEGVFRLTRNPMYLGMVLILAGLAVLLGTLSPYLVCVAFALLLHYRFVRVEERMLAETFGPEWQAYRDRTRRWI